MEPIRSIDTINTTYSAGIQNLLSTAYDERSYSFSSPQEIRSEEYTQRQLDEQTTQSAYDRDRLRELFFTVTDSAHNLVESLGVKRNLTYSRTARQDRLMPADFQTKRTMFNSGDTGSTLAGSYNMPRVQKGSVSINNTVISIDPTVDSYADIITRINNSTAGVFARHNLEEDTLVISSLSNGKIEITGDSAHFLEESNIAISTHEKSTETLSLTVPGSPRSASEALSAMNTFVSAYNTIMDDDTISQDIKTYVTESTNALIARQLSVSSDQKGLNVGGGSLYFDFSSNESKPITYDLQNSYNTIKKYPSLFTGFFAGQEGYSDKIKTNIENALQYIESNQAGENVNIHV